MHRAVEARDRGAGAWGGQGDPDKHGALLVAG
jgi:hypothetical protein